jgi:4-hydroxy-3-methylbut-2-enyl diphosphate reductase
MIEVTIDKNSGFCFGVVKAIQSAERELHNPGRLYCLGDIVHNNLEVERLKALGLATIGHGEFERLRNRKVLLRAHGEPPLTYATAKANGITIVDATCPVVLRLQQKIHKCFAETRHTNAQLVIYGKKGHAEVNGLVGQTEGTAIVIERPDDLDKLDFNRPILLFSQTTKSLDGFRQIVDIIQRRIGPRVPFEYFDTICRQVANRLPGIKTFASRHDRIYFVADKKSSNGKMLFEECLKANPNSLFISRPGEIVAPLPAGVRRIGVCGATSTPKWLMEEVAVRIKEINIFTPIIHTEKKYAMKFSLLSYSIFEQATRDYHLADHVDAPVHNPYAPPSIEHDLYLKNRIDAIQWHLEDIIRHPSIDPPEALAIKRRIDASNQERTDLVERIDSYFLDLYKDVDIRPDAIINTESPAWAIDRLSILALKIYHMSQEASRADATPAHRDACKRKLAVLLEQKDDLSAALDRLLDDIAEGKKYMKVYKQMKMYNDPVLNPVLYGQN